ncbi:ADP-ribosylglycohydrolase family protein [Agromyces sp. LHK192]|uniref:ADP-ribosylglycohydrolase family protein n=1 Tax=Agromyces sp. LHK192 TaxID=2498704 RepID=UPI000FD9695E|nr:ADP-ribosylglycohydrolase family protein [Agromyces sp. LHK192]
MVDAAVLDRAIGAVIGSAAGDALGAPYEFKPPLADEVPVTMHAGGPWELGEWTDDTSMAVPLLQELAAGNRFDDPLVLGRVVLAWKDWSRTAKDVGIQTRRMLGLLSDASATPATEASARAAAKAVHDETGRSGGNGSLMRTGPLALGYLGDGEEAALAAAARRVSELTHFEDDAGDASVIWSLAIRHAIRTGELDLRAQVEALPAERRALWLERIDVAEATLLTRDVPGGKGWVVAALQAAWSAIHHGADFADSIERAVRCGNDTDTVAAIAGSLAGAHRGASAVPAAWTEHLHGWPGLAASDLAELARSAVDLAASPVVG